MGHIVSVHSYRGGTGKSNLTSNLAYQVAKMGRRVAIIDTDLKSPGAHMIFGLAEERITGTLTDFVEGRCELEEVAYDMSADLELEEGSLYLLPSSMKLESIMGLLDKSYDVARLNKEFVGLMDSMDLDFLFVDTHPGLNRETMLTTAISDFLLLIVRPDRQDFHGTALLVELARRLGIPHVLLVANKVTRNLDSEEVKNRLEEAFSLPMVGLLPLDETLAALGSRGLFSKQYDDHLLSLEIRKMAQALLSRSGAISS